MILSVPTSVQMRTEDADSRKGLGGMEGTKPVCVRFEGHEMVHEVWLAHIQDPCIIGLDLLACWGPRPMCPGPGSQMALRLWRSTPVWGGDRGGAATRVAAVPATRGSSTPAEDSSCVP